MNPDRNLPQLLADAKHWFDTALAAAMADAGERPITLGQQNVFAHLPPDGATVSDLARWMDVARQSAHQAVHALIGMGLLEQTPDPASARRRIIVMTAEGRRVHRLARTLIARLEDDLGKRLGPPTLTTLRQTLERPWGPAALEAGAARPDMENSTPAPRDATP
ncbi:MarR family winged helix-turn-helix transcriptional regulator [Streptomyces sp. NPDC017529]|uniref:MarR family winged helix-turn-helix transcriptional regulator n=1 Tax=Streptomyces sp. NPDC017529 TaxID=3365000 RepID=UPI0037AD34B9